MQASDATTESAIVLILVLLTLVLLGAGDKDCRTTCPAAAHTTDDGQCEDDVCCGDVNANAYTVYAVGGKRKTARVCERDYRERRKRSSTDRGEKEVV